MYQYDNQGSLLCIDDQFDNKCKQVVLKGFGAEEGYDSIYCEIRKDALFMSKH